MAKKLTLLVDGENLLKTSFHGNSGSYWNEVHIGGLKTFFDSLRRIINEQHPTKVIICWDGMKAGKMRYDIYRGYKANRKGKDYYNDIELSQGQIYREEQLNKSLLNQRIRIKQYAEELFFRQVSIELVEADDLIGYYCTFLREENEEVLIYSNDRDFCQLLDENISLYLPNKKVIITPKNFFLFFEYHPDNSVLIKTIEGDDSDNIYGVDGVKLKTLLKYFPEIKEKKVEINEILDKAKKLVEEKKFSKHKSLHNLIEGRNFGELKGLELYQTNEKLVDLKHPFMTEDATEALKDCKYLPLDDTDRGSKNLLKYMMEDGSINLIFGGASKFAEYLQPFLFVVKEEKEFLKNYNKNN